MNRFSFLFFFAFSYSWSLEAGPILTPKTKWSFQTQGAIRSAPVADHDNLYFGSADGYLYAVRKSDGGLIWKFQSQGAITGAPALGNGQVVISSRDNNVYALDVRTGTLKWKFQMQPILPYDWHWEYYTSAPVFNGTQIIVGSGDGNLYALTALQGKMLWKLKTNGRIRATPRVIGDVIYQPSVDGMVYVVNAKNGNLLWKFETDGANIDSKKFGWDRNAIYSLPAIEDSVMVLAARDGIAYAVNINTHREKWRVTYGPSWAMSAAIDNGVAYFGWSDNDLLNAVDLNTGKVKWEFKAGSFVYSTPVITPDEIFFNSGDRNVYCLNKETGAKKWEYTLGGPALGSPLLESQTLYVGSDDGKMYAIEDGVKPIKAVFQPVAPNAMYENFLTVDKRITPYLKEHDFEQLDSLKLYQFLTKRIADKDPSVIVFPYGYIPGTFVGTNPALGLIRQYLETGGKIVWFGNVPITFTAGKGLDSKPAFKLLDVDFVRPNESGNYYSKTTQTGLNWGLPSWFTSTFANVDEKGITPLAYDEYNRISAWLKKFNDRPGSGFVSVRSWSYNTPARESDLEIILRLALHELE